jgi:hypothetical protein
VWQLERACDLCSDHFGQEAFSTNNPRLVRVFAGGPTLASPVYFTFLHKEAQVHLSVPTLTSLAMLVILVSSVAAEAAATDRYCLRGRHSGFPGNCQFATRAQCQAAASGTNAYCGINPRYAASSRGR